VGEKILIVDDNSDTREVLAWLLHIERFEVLTARDGLEGLKVASDEHPDLVITDVNMPNLDGIRMIKRLRENPSFKNLPILSMTAFGPATEALAARAGANRVHSKPLEFDLLVDDVKTLLRPERNALIPVLERPFNT
jgi:DNA-binding response OmpR family regulator